MKEIEIVNKQNTLISELMKMPNYKKLGQDALAIIIAKCQTMGIDPFIGLNGGMYAIQGKIEMTSSMMNMLIRQAKHSITKDRKSDDTICILHGKRADNGDTWTESFSIQDAKKAGLLNEKSYNSPWVKYTKDMLFNRALSRLARQLFPDVIQGCYVEGELRDNPTTMLTSPDKGTIQEINIETNTKRNLNDEEKEAFIAALDKSPKFKEIFTKWCEEKQKTIDDVTYDMYDRVMRAVQNEEEPE